MVKFRAFLLFLLIFVIAIFSSNYRNLNNKLRNLSANSEIVAFKPNLNLPSGGYYGYDFEINFIFDKNNKPLANLFQTSNVNSGIRAEFSPEGELYLLVRNSKDKLNGFNLTKFLKMGENSLKFSYLQHKISINFNGNDIPSSHKNLDPKFDNIIAGKGFNDERVYNQKVEIAKIIKKELPRADFSFYAIACSVFGVILLIFSFFKSKFHYELPQRSFNKNQINELLNIRALAWIMVFVIHSYANFGYKFSKEENRLRLGEIDLSFLIYPSAWGGVWIFFVLSGFLMGKNFLSGRYQVNAQGMRNFYLNRVIQIVPIYIFCVFFLAFFMHPEIFHGENLKALFRFVTFTNYSNLSVSLNGALWTLSTEIQFYVLVPFLVIICNEIYKKFGSFNLFFIIIALGFINRLWLHYYGFYEHKDFTFWNNFIYKPIFSNLDLFLAGMCVNFLIDDYLKGKYKGIFKPKFAFWFFVVIFLVGNYAGYRTFVFLHKNWSQAFVFLMPTLTAIGVAYLIFCVEARDVLKNIYRKNMSIVNFFGALTFTIYVWHEPVLKQINQSFSDLTFMAKFGLGVLFTTLIALMMYYFIEKPMRNLKKAKSG